MLNYKIEIRLYCTDGNGKLDDIYIDVYFCFE